MSFSFGFTSESFSDDELDDSETLNTTTLTNPAQVPAVSTEEPAPVAPELLDFNELINSLIGTRLTFETVKSPKGHLMYRRELFDVKHQLMSEDGTISDKYNRESTNDVLLGLDSTSDLLKNVYEGGFKSWECSIDLVDRFASGEIQNLEGDILELGCGTALPSCFLLTQLLKVSSSSSSHNIVLSDYNAAVLRLVTLPNLILAWASTLDPSNLEQLQREQDPELPIVPDELQLSQSLINSFISDLNNKSIKISLISGAWGSQFLELLTSVSKGFSIVYTSETIYSPSTLPILVKLLLDIIQLTPNCAVYVAAKDIYFGVGGNVVEFLQALEANITSRGLNLQVDVAKVALGLQRSIILIK